MKIKAFFIVPLTAAVVTLISVGPGFAQQNSGQTGGSQPEDSQGEATESQAFLGLGVTSIHPAIASHLPKVIGKGRGVMVANVTKDSPAADAGLQVHDILVTYDKQDVYSPEQLVKLVRNDKPGREVELGYVHGGELYETTIELGKSAKRAPVRPGLGFRFPLQREDLGKLDLGRFGLRPDMDLRQGLADDASRWTEFQSMSVTKNEDGNYRAEIKYRHENENVERIYEGSREEIKDAVNADEELPQQVKNHILRAVDERPNIRDLVPENFFRGFDRFDRDLFNRDMFDRELFSWPDVDF